MHEGLYDLFLLGSDSVEFHFLSTCDINLEGTRVDLYLVLVPTIKIPVRQLMATSGSGAEIQI